jgi:hypothetical protein
MYLIFLVAFAVVWMRMAMGGAPSVLLTSSGAPPSFLLLDPSLLWLAREGDRGHELLLPLGIGGDSEVLLLPSLLFLPPSLLLLAPSTLMLAVSSNLKLPVSRCNEAEFNDPPLTSLPFTSPALFGACVAASVSGGR